MAEELKEKDTKKKVTTKKSTTTTRKKTEGTATKTKGTTRKTTVKKKEVDDKEKVKKTTSKRATTKKKEETEDKTTAKKTTTKKTGTTSTTKKETRVTGKRKKIVEPEEVIEELEEDEIEESLIVKKNPTDIVIDNKTMETIEKEIEKQKSIPEKEQNKMNKKIFKNIIIGSIMVLYFIFINLGFYNLSESTYLVDLQVFSAITIGITIVIFERAYRKDSGEITIHGIEMLFLSILTLLTLFIYTSFYEKYTYIINSMATLFATYYAIKSTVIFVKMKKVIMKENSDVRKIIKK